MKNKLLREFIKFAAGFIPAAAAFIGTKGPLWWALIWAFAFGWMGFNVARWALMWFDERRRRRERIRNLKNSTREELEKREIIRCASGFADELAYKKTHRNDRQCVVIKGYFGGAR